MVLKESGIKYTYTFLQGFTKKIVMGSEGFWRLKAYWKKRKLLKF